MAFMKRKILLFTLALPVVLLQSAQAQTFSRLVASADWTSNGAVYSPVDSATYAWSSGRGGALNLNPTNIDAVNGNPASPMQYDN